VVLDRRILAKPYGKSFLSALPEMKFLKGTDLLGAAEKL